MDNVRIFYLRDSKGFPVACVASMLLAGAGKDDALPRLVRFAMSMYNHSDRIQKPSEFPYLQSRGREIALGRLIRGRNKARLLEVEADTPIKHAVVREIMDTTIRPQVREACECWFHEQKLKEMLREAKKFGAEDQADGNA